MIKPLLISTNITNGAGRAAFRLHQAFLQKNICSQMQVAIKTNDYATINDYDNKLQKILSFSHIKPILAQRLMRLQRSSNPIMHSPACFPSGLVAKLNASSMDVLHLHWICDEFLSIEDIGRLTKPLIWTIHDMWPFCGAAHYEDDSLNSRWNVGYHSKNQPPGNKGFDIDRWVWNRKRRSWQNPIYIVAPSQWLANCVKKSVIMKEWPISVIPNPVDPKQFRPWTKAIARQVLGLPEEMVLVLFGAIGGGKDLRKGWDLLQPALAQIANQIPDLAGVIFGQSEPHNPPRLGIPLYWMGHLHDDATLALLYSAADVMVVPSRQDNLPQSGTEAQMCGCPVVAFNTSGLPEVVIHHKTGYLANPFDVHDLARGIVWILADRSRHNRLSNQSRERSLNLWSPDVVVRQYLTVYEQTVEMYRQLNSIAK